MIEPAVALKVAEAAFIATVTDAGTAKPAELLLRVTAVAALAGADRVTVQAEVALEASVEGVQEIDLTEIDAGALAVVIDPPAPVLTSAFPVGSTAEIALTAMEAVDAVEPNVAVTVATTPFAIREPSGPARTHVYAPGCPLQEIDLPAAAAEGPGTTDSVVTDAVG